MRFAAKPNNRAALPIESQLFVVARNQPVGGRQQRPGAISLPAKDTLESNRIDRFLQFRPALDPLLRPFNRRAHTQSVRSKVRYWIASLTCSGVISLADAKSATVRETVRI